MQLIDQIVAKAEPDLASRNVVAIGVTSQVNTHVFVDANGRALMPAISWQDQRCADTADAIDARIDAKMRSSLWGDGFKLDASHLLSRAQWVKDNLPDVWSLTRWIMSPKDYCLMRLTGEPLADAISSFGLVGPDGIYLSEAFDLVAGVAAMLPPLRPMTDQAGVTMSSFRLPNRPVAVGVMDAWASLYGSGAARHGDAFQVSGTSEIIAAVSNDHRPVPGVVTFPPIFGWYLHAGPTQLGGEAVSWFAEFMDISIPDVFRLAQEAKHTAQPLLFLPHVMGERAPIWDAKAKGVFAGIARCHTRHDLAYSVLEGVGHAARLLVSRVQEAAGYEIESLRLSGGAARSDLWCQIKSNVMNRQLERLHNRDTGTFGAALIAGVSQKYYSDLAGAAESAVKIERVFEPDPEQRDRCDEMHEAYIACYAAVSPINNRLHDFAVTSAK
jgi:xylulokinase